MNNTSSLELVSKGCELDASRNVRPEMTSFKTDRDPFYIFAPKAMKILIKSFSFANMNEHESSI